MTAPSFSTPAVQPCSLWWIATLCCGIALLGSDVWTKYLAHSYFSTNPLHADIPIWHNWQGIDFTITYVPNRSAAWGWLSNWQYPLLILRIATVTALIGYLSLTSMRPLRRLLLTLVASGALGNIFDTFIYGYVVDIFLFTFWGHDFAVFNLADSAITLGVTALILEAYYEGRQKPYV